MKKLAIIFACFWMFTSCASSFGVNGVMPKTSNAAQMNHGDTSTPVEEDVEKQDLEQKSGGLVIGLIAAGVAVGAAVIIPLAVSHKL